MGRLTLDRKKNFSNSQVHNAKAYHRRNPTRAGGIINFTLAIINWPSKKYGVQLNIICNCECKIDNAMIA